ncbi:hypothetical protein OHA02_17305 [Streptomyces phaeochromogenes]|nr:hypothetical protein [Streptomyces phaeochromogenes]
MGSQDQHRKPPSLHEAIQNHFEAKRKAAEVRKTAKADQQQDQGQQVADDAA